MTHGRLMVLLLLLLSAEAWKMDAVVKPGGGLTGVLSSSKALFTEALAKPLLAEAGIALGMDAIKFIQAIVEIQNAHSASLETIQYRKETALRMERMALAVERHINTHQSLTATMHSSPYSQLFSICKQLRDLEHTILVLQSSVAVEYASLTSLLEADLEAQQHTIKELRLDQYRYDDLLQHNKVQFLRYLAATAVSTPMASPLLTATLGSFTIYYGAAGTENYIDAFRVTELLEVARSHVKEAEKAQSAVDWKETKVPTVDDVLKMVDMDQFHGIPLLQCAVLAYDVFYTDFALFAAFLGLYTLIIFRLWSKDSSIIAFISDVLRVSVMVSTCTLVALLLVDIRSIYTHLRDQHILFQDDQPFAMTFAFGKYLVREAADHMNHFYARIDWGPLLWIAGSFVSPALPLTLVSSLVGLFL